MLPVEPPADPGLAHPGRDRVEVVVAEPEAAPYGRSLHEVEDLAGGGAATDQVEQLGGDAEQRVGLGERTVGQPHPQPVGGVAAVDEVAEAERRR